jgi:uncharacterized cupin superfamily protein
MTLRTPDGLEALTTGDVVFFEMGESGAHQFYNHSLEPCTYLDIRTYPYPYVHQGFCPGKESVLQNRTLTKVFFRNIYIFT